MYRADGMRAALEVVQDAQQLLRRAVVARIGPPGAQPAPDGGQELGGLLDEERQDLGVERLRRRLRARCDWFGSPRCRIGGDSVQYGDLRDVV